MRQQSVNVQGEGELRLNLMRQHPVTGAKYEELVPAAIDAGPLVALEK